MTQNSHSFNNLFALGTMVRDYALTASEEVKKLEAEIAKLQEQKKKIETEGKDIDAHHYNEFTGKGGVKIGVDVTIKDFGNALITTTRKTVDGKEVIIVVASKGEEGKK